MLGRFSRVELLARAIGFCLLAYDKSNASCRISAIANGKVVSQNDGSNLPNDSDVDLGTKVTVSCSFGYVLHFGQTNKRIPATGGSFECLDTGLWKPLLSPAKCDPDYTLCGTTTAATRVPRVFSSWEAVTGEFPWLVRLEMQKASGDPSQCGGMLITNNWVLTAAHCLSSDEFNSINVDLGRSNFSDPNDVKYFRQRNTRKYCLHPVYASAPGYNYDFALVKINPVVFNEGIRKICLPAASQCSYDINSSTIDGCHDVSVAGWGATIENGRVQGVSPVLKAVNLQISSRSQCKKTSGFEGVTPEQICAGSDQPMEDSCRGDSGGPLMCTKGKFTFAIGIVSFGNLDCGQAGYPAVYSRVCSALPWISSVIKNDGLNCTGSVTEKSPETVLPTTNAPLPDSLCHIPLVGNGDVLKVNLGTNDFSHVAPETAADEGTIISLSCKDGYIPSTDRKTCSRSGTWVPTSPALQCKPLAGCLIEISIANGTVAPGSFNIGSVRAVICNEGYTIYGERSVTCQQNGAWSQPKKCMPTTSFRQVEDLLSKWFRDVKARDVQGVNSDIEQGINRDTKDYDHYDYTALHYCAESNSSALIVELLLGSGAQVNPVNSFGDTPLHTAAKSQNVEIATILIKHGANLNARNRDGDTPLIIATRSHVMSLVQLFTVNGANVNAATNNGWTALHYSLDSTDRQIIDYLIANGANVNAKTSDNATPLFRARQLGRCPATERLSICNLLILNGANFDREPGFIASGQERLDAWLLQMFTAVFLLIFH